MLSKNIHFEKPKKLTWQIPAIVAGGVIFLVLILGISYNHAIHTPILKDNSQLQEFEITKGQGLEQISINLEKKHLIKSHFVFAIYLKSKGLAGKIQAGSYYIPIDLSVVQVADIITKGQYHAKRITVPEGWTIDQIGGYLEKNLGISKYDFKQAAVLRSEYNVKLGKNVWNYQLDSMDGSGLKDGDSLEGFLYPDTYDLTLNPTAEEVVGKMLTNFEQKLTPTLKSQIAKSNMSLHDVVTLASVVEKEAVKTEDRKLVAGVFESRLNIGMPLQSDVTVLYALGRLKGSVSYEDTQTNSPYNTYKVAGLPAGPVCGPSLSSIEAVVSPTKSNYLYFLAAPDGTVYYSKTVDEHNAKKVKYLD